MSGYVSGYVLQEQFKMHKTYFVRVCGFGGVEMSSRIDEARTWPTRGGARVAKFTYRLRKARIVKVPEVRA